MSDRVARRAFLAHALAAPGALVAGFDPHRPAWAADRSSADRSLERLPRLEGRLRLDDAARGAAALDNGNIVHRRPRAVLEPASVDDVVTIVRYAAEHGLSVAMRGQGHTVFGQTQAEGGIVIDSHTLGRVLAVGPDYVDAEPGALWQAVTDATLAKGLTPAVMPDALTLSVGGGVSAGTWGHLSHRFGGLVDTVTELDVVTGTGELVTCSADQEPELFEMVLAGFGQCALIVRARIHLEQAPAHVMRQDLVYEDLDAFYADQRRLIENGRFEHVEGKFIKNADERWVPHLHVGSFSASTEAELAALQEGLGFTGKDEAVLRPYNEYLATKSFVPLPETDRERDEMRTSRRNPSIVMWLPAAIGQSFIEEHVLGSRTALAGAWVFASTVMDTTRFTRPLFTMPDERLAISLWLFRSAPVEDRQLFADLLATGHTLIERMRDAGGKLYQPYGIARARSDWQQHYGPEAWQRLEQAKRRYDPNNILTPGPGIFTDPPPL